MMLVEKKIENQRLLQCFILDGVQIRVLVEYWRQCPTWINSRVKGSLNINERWFVSNGLMTNES